MSYAGIICGNAFRFESTQSQDFGRKACCVSFRDKNMFLLPHDRRVVCFNLDDDNNNRGSGEVFVRAMREAKYILPELKVRYNAR